MTQYLVDNSSHIIQGINACPLGMCVTYPTSNAKLLACDTANEHALERHAAAVRQLSNGTNGDDLYISITTVGNAIQTVNFPIYEYMNTPGNTATCRQHKVVCPWLGANLQCISQHTTESAH